MQSSEHHHCHCLIFFVLPKFNTTFFPQHYLGLQGSAGKRWLPEARLPPPETAKYSQRSSTLLVLKPSRETSSPMQADSLPVHLLSPCPHPSSSKTTKSTPPYSAETSFPPSHHTKSASTLSPPRLHTSHPPAPSADG